MGDPAEPQAVGVDCRATAETLRTAGCAGADAAERIDRGCKSYARRPDAAANTAAAAATLTAGRNAA